MEKRKRHPLNAKGDFFVEYDMCLACDAPYSEAPELMAYDENTHCYFKRQPQNPEEVEHAINAVRASCIEVVRYGGNDPEILKKIETLPCKNKTVSPKTFGENFIEKISKITKILRKKDRDK